MAGSRRRDSVPPVITRWQPHYHSGWQLRPGIQVKPFIRKWSFERKFGLFAPFTTHIHHSKSLPKRGHSHSTIHAGPKKVHKSIHSRHFHSFNVFYSEIPHRQRRQVLVCTTINVITSVVLWKTEIGTTSMENLACALYRGTPSHTQNLLHFSSRKLAT